MILAVHIGEKAVTAYRQAKALESVSPGEGEAVAELMCEAAASSTTFEGTAVLLAMAGASLTRAGAYTRAAEYEATALRLAESLPPTLQSNVSQAIRSGATLN